MHKALGSTWERRGGVDVWTESEMLLPRAMGS